MSFNSFPDKKLIASLSAKMLIEIGAINFRPSDPYILTSGKASPVYIDCRKIISYPRVRRSEERRVGKECRSRGLPYPLNKQKSVICKAMMSLVMITSNILPNITTLYDDSAGLRGHNYV